MLRRQHTRTGRVLRCTPVIRQQVFLGEEPQSTVERWRVLVRWNDGALSRLSSQKPLRRGESVQLPA